MRPRWKLVGVFYGIAFGWVAIVALALYVLGAGTLDAAASKVAQLALAFLYMPAPLVAALIVERLAGEGYLIRYTFQGFGRKLLRLIVLPVVAMGAVVLLDIALTYVLGNVLNVWGVGTLASTSQQMVENLAVALGPALELPADAASTMPSPALLVPIAVFSGLAAGFTVNGLFAFGEEYGWRGWLMNELRPLGSFKANLLTGAMWGLWHAPVILMGFNYGGHRLVGPLFMVILCVPLSFLLWRGRDYTGSTLGPAIMHGALNGSAGFFLWFVGGANELVRVPVGVLGAASFAIVAAVVWWVSGGHLRNTLDPERSEPEQLVQRSNPEGGVTVGTGSRPS